MTRVKAFIYLNRVRDQENKKELRSVVICQRTATYGCKIYLLVTQSKMTLTPLNIKHMIGPLSWGPHTNLKMRSLKGISTLCPYPKEYTNCKSICKSDLEVRSRNGAIRAKDKRAFLVGFGSMATACEKFSDGHLQLY